MHQQQQIQQNVILQCNSDWQTRENNNSIDKNQQSIWPIPLRIPQLYYNQNRMNDKDDDDDRPDLCSDNSSCESRAGILATVTEPAFPGYIPNNNNNNNNNNNSRYNNSSNHRVSRYNNSNNKPNQQQQQQQQPQNQQQQPPEFRVRCWIQLAVSTTTMLWSNPSLSELCVETTPK